jgi:anaphase-promoting complex subunit 3
VGIREITLQQVSSAHSILQSFAKAVYTLSFFQLEQTIKLLSKDNGKTESHAVSARSRKRPLSVRDVPETPTGSSFTIAGPSNSRSSSADDARSQNVVEEEGGMTLTLLALAHFELGNYAESLAHFQAAREIDPWRLTGCDCYSTLLWHLRKESALSQLASQLREFAPTNPVTLVVLGNLMSLQKNSQQAVKCFQKAAQLDPRYAYARTLEGHEHLHREEFDEAEVCFRGALSISPRHYNAWYGLGQAALRQEKFDQSHEYFLRAMQINSVSSVLRCFFGMAQSAMGNHAEALQTFTWCCQRTPNHLVARFHRAQCLEYLDRVSEALQEMEKVRGMAPLECAVFTYLARLYEKQGNLSKSLEVLEKSVELAGANRKEINAQIESLQQKLKATSVSGR